MKITIISVFPELFETWIATSLIGRAVSRGLVTFNFLKLSDVCLPKERIDEPTCGSGAGMILKPEVVERAFQEVFQRWGDGVKIFFSPKGKRVTQREIKKVVDRVSYAAEEPVSSTVFHNNHIILFCARYEGIDDRVEKYFANEIFSIGDYVLMGGDLAAQVFLEAFLRLVPEVVGKAASVENDSFFGPFLDYPEYGLPIAWQGQDVPDVCVQVIMQWLIGGVKSRRVKKQC